MRFFSPEAGQRRRKALDEFASGVEQFIPPNLRPAAEAVAQMNPVQGMQDAMQASGVAFDPAQTAEARKRAAVDMGVEMAMTLAPAALARMGYLAAPAGLMETFATPSVDAAVDMGQGLLSDATYAARSIGEGDFGGVFDAFRPSGQAQSLSAAASDTPSKMRAFHGTPHDFDQFDMTRIGTGEGAQAYGHGLYFAESEGIARHYKDKLRKTQYPNELFIQGEPFNNPNAAQAKFMVAAEGNVPIASSSFSDPDEYRYVTRGMSKGIFDALMTAPDDVDALTAAQRAIDNYISSNEFYPDEMQTVNAMAQSMLDKVSKDVSIAPSGRMYEVRINAAPEDFINYDARLDEQSDLVKSVLGSGEEVAGARLKRAYDNEMFGGDMIGQDRATPEQVSQGLLSRGIKGIRYLDASSRGMGYKINLSRKGEPYETEPIEAGSRRQAEALAKEYQEKGFDTNIEAIGNRNMVVFDDRLVEIVRKYGIAGAAALLGVSSADIEGALAQGMPEQPKTGLLQ